MKQNMFVILLILVLGLFIVGCNETIVEEPVEPVEDSTETIETDSDINEDVYVEVPVEEVSEDVDEEIMVTASGVKYLVNPNKILSGGPPMDGIPSLDNPKYVSLEEADEWIEDNELVLAIIYKGVKRVYPLQILVWHEIVNDHIAGDPLLITYCPLCGSGIALKGRLILMAKEKKLSLERQENCTILI